MEKWVSIKHLWIASLMIVSLAFADSAQAARKRRPITTSTTTTSTTTTTTMAQQVGQSADGTMVPPSTQIIDAGGNIFTISSSMTVLRNGVAAGYSANVVLLIYKSEKLYQQNSAGGFWYYDGNGGWIASGDPRISSSPSTTTSTTSSTTTTMPRPAGQSAEGTLVPPSSQIVDASGAIYTISAERTVLRNGVAAGYTANVSLLLYYGGKVYQRNDAGGFWYYDGAGGWVASSDPRAPVSQPPSTVGLISMPIVPNPIPPDSIRLYCGDNERSFQGAFYVENNKWGASGVYPSEQCAGIGGMASDGSVSAKWHWNYGTGPNEVKGYPSISYGQRPGWPKPAGSVLPKVVDDISYAQVAYNGTSSANGKGHNAFDIWLTTDGVDRGIFFNNNITHEIMISTNNWGTYGDFPNPAWLYENEVTIDGIRYRVTKADNFPPGGVGGRVWRFVVFKMLDDRPAAALNLKSFFQYLKSRGLITGREFMNSIEYGTEQEHGSGEVKIHGYKLDIR